MKDYTAGENDLVSAVVDNRAVTARKTVVNWLTTVDAKQVSQTQVPGASEQERRHLGALGGLVRDLIQPATLRSLPSDLSDWMNEGPDTPRLVTDAATDVLAVDPDAALADLYTSLVTPTNRRWLGTFFTPAQEVALMLDMWDEQSSPPATVIDVGAGVGVFTVSAGARWPKAAVYSVDVNPVTLGLLALRMDGTAPLIPPADRRTPGIRLISHDYTEWIASDAATCTAPRLILGNPPYTRSQLLAGSERERLTEAAGGLCGSRASLSTLITAITLRHLGPDDGLCLLLPAQWLESNYARPLRNHLAQMRDRRVDLRMVDSWRFADALVDAVALLVGPSRESSQRFTVANWRSGNGRAVDRKRLVDTSWRSLFDSQPRLPKSAPPPTTAGPPSRLSDYCDSRRGTATGANAFFLLTDRQADEHRIPQTRLLPLARRLINFADVIDETAFGAVSSTERRWMLIADQAHRYPGSALDEYLKRGEADGLNNRELCRTRKAAWYDLAHDLVTPDVIIGPTTRRGLVRFVENPLGCAIVNNLYGWNWHRDVEDETRAAVLRWLRSPDGQQAILGSARRQGDGLYKIEPKALARLPIPAHIARPTLSLL